MKSVQVVVQGVTPIDFAGYQKAFTSEGFEVTPTSVDTFVATYGKGLKLAAAYNRNQQTLTVQAGYSAWVPGYSEDFLKENVLRVLGKDDATGIIQPTPLKKPATPVTADKPPVVVPPTPPATTNQGTMPSKPVEEQKAEPTTTPSPRAVTPPTVTPKSAA